MSGQPTIRRMTSRDKWLLLICFTAYAGSAAIGFWGSTIGAHGVSIMFMFFAGCFFGMGALVGMKRESSE